MNETVNLSQLIVRLGEVTGADSNTSRRFLREFFATVGDVLAEEGDGASLTLPGIGTFMRSSGADGSSPATVVFQADEALLGEANKPFAAFEAVELAPGITADDLTDEPQEETSEEIDEEDEIEDSPTPAPSPEPVAEADPEPKAEEETPAPAEPAVMDEPRTNEPRTAPVPPPVVPSFPEEEDEDEATDYLPQPPHRKSGAWGWIIAVGLIAGIAVGLWFGMTVDVDLPDDSIAVEEEATVDGHPSAEPEVEAEQGGLPVDEVQVPQPEEPQSASQPVREEPVYETVSPTNYLSSMARRHYGAQIYWVYIYEANSDILGHPDRIAPGTRVVIPPKSSFPEASSEAEARRIAERKAAEINRRFR